MDTGEVEPEIVENRPPPPNISRNIFMLFTLNRVYEKMGAHVYDGSNSSTSYRRDRRRRNRAARLSRRKNRKKG